MNQVLAEARAKLAAPGSPFAVEEIELNGIRVRAFEHAPPNLRVVWEATAAHGDATYLVYEDERLSYADVHRRVRALASVLRDDCGIAPADRVALALRNYPEWIVAYWATISIGGVVVALNGWWTASELEYGLRDSGSKLVIADAERVERIRSLRDAPPILGVRAGDAAVPDLAELIASAGDDAELPDVAIEPDDGACVLYTSGTTGEPKGALLTHRGCVTNLLNMAYFNAILGLVEPSQRDDSPKYQPSCLLAVPLFHVTGCNCVMHPITAAGGKLVLMYRWDADLALQHIEAERITTMTGVPTMARELVTSPNFDRYDTSSLSQVGGGGAPIPPDLVHKIDEDVPSARPGTGYGMTEACGVVTVNAGSFYTDKPDTVGPPLPTCEIITVDAAGDPLPIGGVGEIWVRGANIIHEYLNRPEETAEAITDGWYHTGDVGYLDEDGFLTVSDRIKDMVIRGGENIYCAEVEAAIYEHDSVAEVAVFGVPDDRLGEVCVAAIVVRPDALLSVDELNVHLADRLAKFKIPEHAWLVEHELPRNANGKFLKRELRASYLGDGSG